MFTKTPQNKKTIKSILAHTVSIVAMACVLPTMVQAQDLSIHIKKQSLASAVTELSKQADIVIVAPSGLLSGKKSQVLNGFMSVEDALDQLLMGTRLKYTREDEATYVVTRSLLQKISYNSSSDFEAELGVSDDDERADDVDGLQLEEVLVTGSHIRGVGPVGSPLTTYSRQDMEMSGQVTLESFMNSMTQNLMTETAATMSGANYIDLRGLGWDATLTLLNGRRMSPSSFMGGSDISAIPASMVDRIEVLTDGASALYGSDAVGGVVNIVLRKDLEGAETNLQYSDTTQGGGEQMSFSQTVGTNWGTGNVIANYSFDRQDHIDNASRDQAGGNPDFGPDYFSADIKEHSGMLLINQELTDSIEFYADVFINKRNVESYRSGSIRSNSAKQLSASAGVRVDLGGDWQADVGVQHATTYNTYDIPDWGSTGFGDFRTQTLDIRLDGPLYTLPGGDVRLAIGGEIRGERYEQEQFEEGWDDLYEMGKRTISGVHGELYVPLVGADNSRPGIAALDFSIAGRYESYNNFGSTFVPKVGVAWAPVEGLKLRGTWGKSSRAPQIFEQLNNGGADAALIDYLFDPANGGYTGAMIISGGNPDLKGESSSNWTIGVDFEPEALPGLNLSMTYFDIKFKNQIDSPPWWEMLEDAAVWGDFITRRPDDAAGNAAFQAQVDNLKATLPVMDWSGGAQVDIIIDSLLTNLAETRNRGLDFTLSYEFDTDLGDFGLMIGGTYILEQAVQPVPGADFSQGYNRVHKPVDLRLRNSLSWSKDNISANIMVNYVDGYIDGRFGLEDEPIDSWTTVDATISYAFEEAGFLEGTRISLSATNLFDKSSPVVTPEWASGGSYDQYNGGIIGRRLSVSLTKAW